MKICKHNIKPMAVGLFYLPKSRNKQLNSQHTVLLGDTVVILEFPYTVNRVSQLFPKLFCLLKNYSHFGQKFPIRIA